MKPFSVSLEFRILRTLAQSKNTKTTSKVFAALDDTCFHTKVCKAIYQRIKYIAQKRAVVLDWEDLATDPAIDEKVRDRIKLYKKKPYKKAESIDGALKRLHVFRQLRLMYYAASDIFEAMKQPTVDAEALLNNTTSKITSARSPLDSREWFTNFGIKSDKSGQKLVKEALKITKDRYVQTGFTAFDTKNVGVPLGSFMMVAANTGGAKTVMMGQLCENMALNGAKVCLIPLEMDGVQMTQRHLSRISSTPMSEILKPWMLSRAKKREIRKAAARFEKNVAKAGGSFTYYIPEEDMTLEELLFILRPYGYTVIGIDYLGLTKGHDHERQWQSLGSSTRHCKRYAAMTHSIIIGAAQLNDENKLKYSKTMEEHANLAWYWNYDEKAKEANIIEVLQKKSRNQTGFSFFLGTDLAHMRFKNLSREKEREIERERQPKEKRETEEKETDRKRKEKKKNPYFSA